MDCVCLLTTLSFVCINELLPQYGYVALTCFLNLRRAMQTALGMFSVQKKKAATLYVCILFDREALRALCPPNTFVLT